MHIRHGARPQAMARCARQSIVGLNAAIVGLLTAALTATPADPAIITVTTTNDVVAPGDGCSLREAIANANNNNQVASADCPAGDPAPSVDKIRFNLGAGLFTIAVASGGLPPIAEAVLIDGTNANGYRNQPLIRLNGTAATTANGLTINAPNVTVKALVSAQFGGSGIEINQPEASVYGSWIGADLVGGAPAGNGAEGIYVKANGAIGIDLADDGVTQNDPGDVDPGTNGQQNFPELRSATTLSGASRVTAALNAAASTTYSVELFSSPTCDTPNGYGEGQVFLGRFDLNTDGTGNESLAATVPVLTLGHAITATATSPMTFAVTLSRASGSPIAVQYTTADVTTTAGQDYQPASGTITFAPGETSQSVIVNILGDIVTEPTETLTVTLGGLTNGATLTRAQPTGTIQSFAVPTPCSPKPAVRVTSAASGGQLRAAIATSPLNGGATNSMTELKFGTLQNARVTLNGQVIASGQTVTLPATTTVDLVVSASRPVRQPSCQSP